jgi:hypothetical protein
LSARRISTYLIETMMVMVRTTATDAQDVVMRGAGYGRRGRLFHRIQRAGADIAIDDPPVRLGSGRLRPWANGSPDGVVLKNSMERATAQASQKNAILRHGCTASNVHCMPGCRRRQHDQA